MSIVLMVCFARSGGTLLNRCIGMLPDVVVISEINPLGSGSGREGDSYQTVHEQAKHWFGVEIPAVGFTQELRALSAWCDANGRRLVHRDWPYINFTPHSFNGYAPPNRLLTLDELSAIGEVIPFAFVRDAIDIWLSTKPPMEPFFQEYRTYVDSLLETGMPVFKYEDFTADPGRVMRELCEATGLTFRESFRDYMSFTHVNGDVQIQSGSRGMNAGVIKPLPRKYIPPQLVRMIEKNPDMISANGSLGYPVKYHARPSQSFFQWFIYQWKKRRKHGK